MAEQPEEHSPAMNILLERGYEKFSEDFTRLHGND